jgi:hypothetical protein
MKIVLTVLLSLLSIHAVAQTPIERIRNTPMTQLDFGLFRLEQILASKISESRNKWGLTSGVSYTNAEAVVENNTLNVILYGTAQAKNLNLKNCSVGITEFDSMLKLGNTLKQIWDFEKLGISAKELSESTVLKLVISEASNSALTFRCYWPISGDMVYQAK